MLDMRRRINEDRNDHRDSPVYIDVHYRSDRHTFQEDSIVVSSDRGCRCGGGID